MFSRVCVKVSSIVGHGDVDAAQDTLLLSKALLVAYIMVELDRVLVPYRALP